MILITVSAFLHAKSDIFARRWTKAEAVGASAEYLCILINSFVKDDPFNHQKAQIVVDTYKLFDKENEQFLKKGQVDFLKKLMDMLDFLIPHYISEGKHQLVVGIGCTGGKHRSVTLANELFERMQGRGKYGLTIAHRDEGNTL